MEKYDPLQAPDPEEWLSMDESERIELVEDYHRRAQVHLPRATVHAIIHVIVENQIALGDEIPVRRTADRLLAEGLDRHEMIHAIGSVLAGFINDLMKTPEDGKISNQTYFAELQQLTAESWRRSA